MEEEESLKSVIAVAVALIGTAIYLRRRYGSIGEMWSAALARNFKIDRATAFKAALAITALLWVGAWIFTTPEQRAELKESFYQNSPFAPVMKTIDPKAD